MIDSGSSVSLYCSCLNAADVCPFENSGSGTHKPVSSVSALSADGADSLIGSYGIFPFKAFILL